jgi:hypothetical protein
LYVDRSAALYVLLEEEDEAEVLAMLMTELRNCYGIRVSGKLEGSRDKLDTSSLGEVVCLGGSNAVRLGDVLMGMG